MGDPLSITAGVAGIISPGLTVCSGLLEYYHTYRQWMPPRPEAARGGHLIIMKTLLEAGVAINSFSGRSRTPLGRAAGCGHAEASRLLLEAGADANITDECGEKPLHKAVCGGHVAVVALLLERGADVDAPGQRNETALVIVAKPGHCDKTAAAIVQILHENGADPTTKDGDFGRTSLEWSILQGHEATVEILLKHDSPDLTRRNLIILLTKFYHVISGNNDEAIDQVLSREEIPCLRTTAKLLLLEIPPKEVLNVWQATEKTALHLASSEGHTAIVQLLLDQKADVNAQTSDGEIPLMLAAGRGRKTIVELLLDNGAKIDSKDMGGGTAHADAVSTGDAGTAKLLLEREADVNIDQSGANGGTVLHLAARSVFSSPLLIEMLLEHAADLEGKDSLGLTPLVVAVRHGMVATVQILLDKGADPRALPHVVAPGDEVVYECDFNDAVELVVQTQKKFVG